MVCARDEKGRGAHCEKTAKCRYSQVDNEGDRERPLKTTWKDTCRRELEIVGLTSDEATDRAVNVRDEDEVRR